jgi:APA family basic amino acid/polyamine antiporter
LGELLAWIIGWDLMLEYAISNIAVAVSWANYCRVFLKTLGISIPWYLCTDYRTASHYPELLATAPHWFGFPIVLNVLAFSVTACLTILLLWGVRESARLNTVMVILKLLVLLFFAVCVLTHVPGAKIVEHWEPFFPNGWRGTFSGAAIVFFAFIGFDTLSTVAEECEQPARSIPRGILGSLLICTSIYVIVAGLFTGAVSQSFIATHKTEAIAEPLTWLLRSIPGMTGSEIQWTTAIVAGGAVIAQTATLLVYQLGQPRIFLSMARDGLLPRFFARIHPQWGTPYVTTLLTGVFVAVASTFLTIDELIDLTNIGTLVAFLLVCLGIPILRYTDPERHRPFRLPGGLVIPAIGVLSNIVLLYYLPISSWWRFGSWLGCGLAVYLLYGYRHSFLGKKLGRAEQSPKWQIALGWLMLISSAGTLFIH